MKSIRVPVSGFSALLFGAALIVALSAGACLGPANAPEREEGFSDADILFGQTAAFSGPAEALGKGMRLGIEAAFHEANASGGVHGRMLKLKAVDDRYEPGVSVQTTERLIKQDRVFALIGAVGTPTSSAASPLANEAGVPFLGPLTGAGILRDPSLSNVFNIRASYHQETEEMIARLTEDLGITRVGVFHQDDSFGLDGLEGVRLALERRGLEPVDSWDYERNSGTNIRAINDIVAANPEAIIMIGTQDAVATTIKLVNRDILPVFMTVSFVGGEALAQTLGEEGNGVYVTQVVPYPTDAGTPVVARYHAALSSYDAEAEPGFVSLEGYLAGRLAISGLETCGRELSRECFMDALRVSDVIDIDGFQLRYGPDDNQGSDAVFLTMIGLDGEYEPVDALRAGS